MLSIHGLPLAIQLFVPTLLLVWLARGGHRGVAEWTFRILIVSTILLGVHAGGLWVVLPWYTTAIFAPVLAVIVLRQRAAIRSAPRAGPVTSPRAAVDATIAIAAVALLTIVVLGRRPPPEPMVELQFPLRDGTYHAVNAGSTELINAHLMTLTADRFRAYRGQSYAVDLVKLGPMGLRATGLLPLDLERYDIYGEPVYAPCDGVVIAALDGAPDMTPPQPDRSRMTGNHVLLECAGVHVVLAHLRSGSVAVRNGDSVTTATQIGVVGNSGNSHEPHLHIHAQRPAADRAEPTSGDPLPISFDGRYLVRNSRLTGAEARQP
jgi:hypothetical protein